MGSATVFMCTLHNKYIKNILIVIVAVALIGFLAYSVVEYRRSGIAERGVVTCSEGQCFWSAHIHLDMPIEICGKKHLLPKFRGPLNDMHTHGDDNIIHWHDKIAFEPANKQFLESNPFELGLIFKTLELPLVDDMLLGKKDGDLCGGFASTWKVFINGTSNPNWRSYEWKDHDIAYFVFDARIIEELEKEFRQKPLIFSPIGEG